MLKDLLSDSLTDIVRQSIGLPEAEWQEVFRQRYVNRSFLLDLRILARTVRMLATGHGLYKGETGGWRPTA